MSAPTVGDFLKYANLQIAAEAFLVDIDENGKATLKNDIRGALVEGNLHASKFTETEATKFESEWQVVDQLPNKTTGFSGTLFRNKTSGELVLSFRSTEFVDDAIRDSAATNTLEVFKTGWAFGQLSDMEAWYADLSKPGGPLAGRHVNVTGYSLGGHLATAFNLLHPGVADQVVTFNGAGVGRLNAGQTLQGVLAYFAGLRADPDSIKTVLGFTTPELASFYDQLRSNLASGVWTATQARGALVAVTTTAANSDEAIRAGLEAEKAPLYQALDAILSLQAEASRIQNFTSGGTPDIPLKVVPATELLAQTLDYRLAVYLASRRTSSVLSVFSKTPGDPSLANQWDLVGKETTTPPWSAVANSGVHYGANIDLFIEDQPLTRGNFLSNVIRDLAGFELNLLQDKFDLNNFADTHSLVLIVDSLAVQNTLLNLLPAGQRDGAAVTDTLNTILKNASWRVAQPDSGQGKAEGDVLENVVNALADLILGPQLKAQRLNGSAEGNTWWDTKDKTVGDTTYAGRDNFYAKLKQITDSPTYKTTLAGKLTLMPSTIDLTSTARNDYFAYAALASLSSFVFKPVSNIDDNAMTAAFGASYTEWQADRDAVVSGKTASTISDQWIANRAAMLAFKNDFNKLNVEPYKPDLTEGTGDNVSPKIAPIYFEDIASDYKIQQGRLDGGTARRFIFGDDTANTDITGGRYEDHLYGGAGDDTITGNKSNDYLEGGIGNDTYVYATGDGFDTVLDVDGNGILKIDDQTLAGGAEYGDYRVFKGQDTSGQNHIYTYVSGGRATGGDLIVDDAFLVKSFRSATGNGMGLAFSDAADDPNPQTNRNILGDPQIHSDTIAPGTEALNWKITNPAHNPQYQDDGQGGQTLVSYDVDYYLIDPTDNNPTETGGPAKNDRLVGSSANDRITGYAGDDLITAPQGGNDVIDAGAGRDKIDAGAGNDVLIGGADGDLLNGGAGDDRLYADSQTGTAAAIANGNLINSGIDQQGDWLAGGAGADTLIGGASRDVLAGGGGGDLLIGGAGDDDILGDAEYAASSFAWSVTNQGDLRVYDPSAGPLAPADGAADVIYAGEGNDYVWAGAGNDVVFGEGGEDRLNGNEGNDILLGGSGGDTLWGGIGEDYLDGGIGIDQLQGGDGDDLLIGGAGDDTIWGDAGRDTYLFNVGDGIDRIVDASTGAQASILVFGAGFDKDSIKLEEGSLLLDMGNGDAIHIENWDQAHPLDTQSFASFQFADGSSLSWSELLARGFDLDGTEGDDIIVGTGLTDRIQGFGGNDALYGLDGADRLDGGAGDDLLEAGNSGQSTLIGGTGQDTLRLHGAGNTITYAVGDGTDVVETAGGVSGTVLRLSGVSAAGLNLGLGQEGEVVLRVGGDAADVLRFADIPGTRATAAGAVDRIEFDPLPGSGEVASVMTWAELMARGFVVQGTAGDDPLTGTAADERLLGGEGDDVLSGGAGNDTLAGGTGLDRYTLEIGTGTDTVIEGTGESSVIALGLGLGIDSLHAVHDGNDLLLEVRATGDRLRLTDYAASDWRIEPADGADITLGEFLARPEPVGAAAVRQRWDDAKARAVAGVVALNAQNGWTALGGMRYESFASQAWGSYSLEVLAGDQVWESSGITWGAYAGPLRVQTDYVIGQVAATEASTTVARPVDTVPVDSAALSAITIAWGNRLNYREWSIPDGGGYAPVYSWNQVGQIVKATPVAGNAPVNWASNASALSSHYDAYVTTSTITSTLLTEVRGNAADNYIDTNNCALDLVDGGAGADILVGDSGDLLYGNDGDDRIFGSSGTQTLIGGEGNDYLNRGAGIDTLVGGNSIDDSDRLLDRLLDRLTDNRESRRCLEGEQALRAANDSVWRRAA